MTIPVAVDLGRKTTKLTKNFVTFAHRPLIVMKSADDIIHQKVVIKLVNASEVKMM